MLRWVLYYKVIGQEPTNFVQESPTISIYELLCWHLVSLGKNLPAYCLEVQVWVSAFWEPNDEQDWSLVLQDIDFLLGP